MNKHSARVAFFCIGSLLLFVAAMVYAIQFAMGRTLSRKAVWLIVGGFACLWIASEL